MPLRLSTVTLCAVTSVNVAATIVALERCLQAAAFAECLLFTDAPVACDNPAIRIIPIEQLSSSKAYSHFMLNQLVKWIRTDHVLIAQWDGFILTPSAWRDEFLDYDYIGAIWPQFETDGTVGNGGFSLRSRRLLLACLDPDFEASHPEDVAICRANRALLTGSHAIRFASPALAAEFSYERTPSGQPTFGFHGVFNMPEAIGNEAFWQTYASLNDRSALRHDFAYLLFFVLTRRSGLRRALRMIRNHLRDRYRGFR